MQALKKALEKQETFEKIARIYCGTITIEAMLYLEIIFVFV